MFCPVDQSCPTKSGEFHIMHERSSHAKPPVLQTQKKLNKGCALNTQCTAVGLQKQPRTFPDGTRGPIFGPRLLAMTLL